MFVGAGGIQICNRRHEEGKHDRVVFRFWGDDVIEGRHLSKNKEGVENRGEI